MSFSFSSLTEIEQLVTDILVYSNNGFVLCQITSNVRDCQDYKTSRIQLFNTILAVFYLPISSISGAILNVIPTSNRHINSNRQAVATIVHFALGGNSSSCRALNSLS